MPDQIHLLLEREVAQAILDSSPPKDTAMWYLMTSAQHALAETLREALDA